MSTAFRSSSCSGSCAQAHSTRVATCAYSSSVSPFASALQPQAEILECGIVLDTTEEDAEPVMLEAADEEEARLLVQAPRYVAASCGFLGHPLPGGHYYGDNSQVGDGLDDNTKVKWSKLGNNAKSAIQEQTSKTLGLRSLG